MKSKSKLFTAAVIACALVLAFTACAGCTSNSSSSSTSTTEDPIVGTYGLDAEQILKKYETVVPSDYEKKLFTDMKTTPEEWVKSWLNSYNIKITINNDGTGKEIAAYSSSSAPEYEKQFTWKKIGDNTYSFVKGESTETITFDPVNGTFTSADNPFKKLT